MKRLLFMGLSLLVLATGFGCGSPQVRPDREQIQRHSDKSFQELRREEQRQQDE